MGRDLNYDPVELADQTRKLVVDGIARKYYRLTRPGRWYGGIATSDCTGCNLKCKFCWSGAPRDHPERIGNFYKPDEVFDALMKCARKFGYSQIRISGNEPTLGKAHLIKLLELVEKTDLSFILETNGTLLDREYTKDLSRFKNLHVRVSLKGTNREEFSRLTGAKPSGFDLQLNALKNLIDAGLSCHPSVMLSFSPKKNLEALKEKIAPSMVGELEEEYVILYPLVVARLKKSGLKPLIAYDPKGVPRELT